MPGWSDVPTIIRTMAAGPREEGARVRRVVDARGPGPSGPRDLSRAARRRWVAELAAGSPALERRLTFGLLGPEDAFTAGAALNTALLWAAGQRAVILDDDVRPVVFPPPRGERGPPGDPTALEVAPCGGLDDPAPLRDALAVLPEALGAPVACLGLRGDSGMRSSSGYLRRGGRWLAARAERWEALAVSRAVHRAAPEAARGAHLMSAALLVDTTDFVPPPLLPVHRNTDGLWGRHLADIGQPALHLPMAVLHEEKPEGTCRVDARRDLLRPRATDLLSLLPVGAWEEARAAGWQESLRPKWRAHLERLAERLDDARRLTPRGPRTRALHEDLELVLRAMSAAARAVPAPCDLPAGDAWAELSRLAGAYLELLEVWPQIWARAPEVAATSPARA